MINLIAARQLALTNQPSLSLHLRHRASLSMDVLESHAQVFTANETGRRLLERFLLEIQSGEYTMSMLIGEYACYEIIAFAYLNNYHVSIVGLRDV